MQLTTNVDLFERTSFGEMTFSCSHTSTFSPGFPTCQVMDAFFEPAPRKVKVCSGQDRPSELTHVYLTSAGPSVVMAPKPGKFPGHLVSPPVLTYRNLTLVTLPFNSCGLGGPGLALVDCATAAEVISNNPSTGVANCLGVFSDPDIRFPPS